MSFISDCETIEPTYMDYQLIGDTHMLKLSRFMFAKSFEKHDLSCDIGLCISGQTTLDLFERLKRNFYAISKKIILMIGTNDLLQNEKIENMTKNFDKCVNELLFKGVEKLLILTLPPVPMLMNNQVYWEKIRTFNNYIRSLHNDRIIFVIDSYPHFVKNKLTNISQDFIKSSSPNSVNIWQPLLVPVSSGGKRKISFNENENLNNRKILLKRKPKEYLLCFRNSYDDKFFGNKSCNLNEELNVEYYEMSENCNNGKVLTYFNENGLRLLNELLRIEIGDHEIKSLMNFLDINAYNDTFFKSTSSMNQFFSSETLRNFNFDENDCLIVYIDGACLNNGKVNAQAGLGVWFNYHHPLNLSEAVVGIATNNNAEIQAALRAVSQAKSIGVRKLKICTDSQFLINCMTNWIWKWKKNGWKTFNNKPVKNELNLRKLDNLLNQMDIVKWEYVKGHAGIEGNMEADVLAKKGAKKYEYKN